MQPPSRNSSGSYGSRNSYEEFTRMLTQNASPVGFDETLIREIKMMEGYQASESSATTAEPLDDSTPEGIYSEYSSGSSPLSGEKDEEDNDPVYQGPMSQNPIFLTNSAEAMISSIMNDPKNVEMDTLPSFKQMRTMPMPQSMFPPAVLHRIKEEPGTDDPMGAKRKKRKVAEDESYLSFQNYVHPKHIAYRICNSDQTDVTDLVDFEVRAEKNIFYSDQDDAWILYKQNQFQISVESASLASSGLLYVQVQKGVFQMITRFIIKTYAIQQNQKDLSYEDEVLVQIFQTGKMRSKEHSHPVELGLIKNGTALLQKLRFQSSTANNARMKNSEPNPNQQYFRIVVSLFAQTQPTDASPNGAVHEIMSRISNRLIVRGQNPGRYASKPVKAAPPPVIPPPPPPVHFADSISAREGWVKRGEDTLYHSGKIGINMPNPQEALSVHGNIMVTGNVVKPSDKRVKENFHEVDTKEQLQHIEDLRIFDYDLKEWTQPSAKHNTRERGVIAQDLEKVIPFAVERLGDVQMKDGQVVQNLLVVNERVLLFENIGATQEIGKILRRELNRTDDHAERLEVMEGGHGRLLRDELANRGRVDKLIDYITTDENEIDPLESCCYCSFFGLGPAWTLWVLGWILPLFWVMGIIFIASWSSSQRRWAGFANLLSAVMCTFFVYLAYMIWHNDRKAGEIAIAVIVLVYFLLGVVLVVSLTIYTNKRNRQRRITRKKLRKTLGKEYEPREIPMRPKFYAYSSHSNLEDVIDPEKLRKMANEAEAAASAGSRPLNTSGLKPPQGKKKRVSFNDVDEHRQLSAPHSLASDKDVVSEQIAANIAAALEGNTVNLSDDESADDDYDE
eukprot:TRINITY_DN2345_c0_g1_i1.p1 TRINITY_DN2345_c0_g1~~TRINITY_DN2345_c0_g1_i1.p1  ORF type:complete len:847 (+),score=295.19 TRINITY_DN2345_c0_g1_i1:224-2764(+)